ncbi:MAG TPA: hypothetical protein VIH59_22930 [Candidatus Tectomicrobia bacterium]
MDALVALRSAVKAGEGTEAPALKRLSQSPHWRWVAMAPGWKLLLAVAGGDRPLAMAQRLVHRVTPVLAPDCAPLFCTEGFRESLPALVTHSGRWTQPARRQGAGRWPQPRWRPPPRLLYGIESWQWHLGKTRLITRTLAVHDPP